MKHKPCKRFRKRNLAGRKTCKSFFPHQEIVFFALFRENPYKEHVKQNMQNKYLVTVLNYCYSSQIFMYYVQFKHAVEK